MKKCDEVITLFNARYDPALRYDKYIPTVITGVSWFLQTITAVDSSGLRAANQFTVRVPVDADFSGKQYFKPLEYANHPTGAGVFTIRAGDIIVHTAVNSAELRLDDLKKQFDEMVTVLSVTDNRNAPHGKHWKVVGK